MIFLELFITFFIIGAFTFGGGYAMLSLIQNQVVTVHQWLTPEEFTDIVAISQMSPGPIGINSATYIGYSVPHAMGFSPAVSVLGSITATFAVVLPSYLLVLWICILFCAPAFGRVDPDAVTYGIEAQFLHQRGALAFLSGSVPELDAVGGHLGGPADVGPFGEGGRDGGGGWLRIAVVVFIARDGQKNGCRHSCQM